MASEALEVQAAARTSASIPAGTVIDGSHVLVVTSGTKNPRRYVYLGLDSAERAVRRARNAGIPATVVLCELRIVGGAE